MTLLKKLRRIALRPFDRGGERVENPDAMAAAAGGAGHADPHSGSGHAGAPPNYVPAAEEGRPRH
jgi:hypothetical protein